MKGIDKRPLPVLRHGAPETPKKSGTRNANTALSKAKAVVSPFFGVNDFAFAYARA